MITRRIIIAFFRVKLISYFYEICGFVLIVVNVIPYYYDTSSSLTGQRHLT